MSKPCAWKVASRRPHGRAGRIERLREGEAVQPYLEDAAHYPGGSCREVCLPESEAEVAALVGEGAPLLVVGAQSSLTGGATPCGCTVVSTARMNGVLGWSAHSVRVGPGLVIAELEQSLRERGLYYPPVPTYDGASVGGTVATNAAGAATFKYGSTRDWVKAVTVVLANGEVLELERGQVCAGPQGRFEIEASNGATTVVEVPGYTMPDVAKRSAGYHAEPGMDLLDLFIGSEGTLGIVVEIELRLLEPRPAFFSALVPLAGDQAAIALVAAVREQSRRTWAERDVRGIDVAAVEYLDRRCLELLGEDGADRALGFAMPQSAGAAILLQAELDADTTRADAFEELGRACEGDVDGRLARLARLLDAHGVFAAAMPVLPGEEARGDALFRLREAVPEAVNRRIRERQRTIDPAISKSSGDVIVPFERFAESLERYRGILERHGLDHAIWGHVSDGNLHPNALPASRTDMERASRAQLEIGEAAIALGGCPMSEHGVGRNRVKQDLLLRLYGREGVAAMRRVKDALDPAGILAPGVLFGDPGRDR